MENRAHHWLIALIAAALFHAAVALALVRTPPPEVARIVTIAIELEPGGSGSDGGQAGTGSDGDGGEPAGDAAEDARIEQAPDPRDERESEPEREQEPRSESTTELAPTADVVAPVPKPEPAVVETPAPNPNVAEKSKPEPKVVPKPRPKPKPAPKPPAERPSAPKAAGESQADTGQSGQAARGKGSGSGTGNGSGKGRGSGGGQGSAKSQSRYYGELAAWLNRHKHYPPAARRNRQTGTVRVTFTIDRNGRVLSKRIVSSSGHAALDQEVEAMLRRASPMPKIPRELGRSTLTVTLPVVFTLR